MGNNIVLEAKINNIRITKIKILLIKKYLREKVKLKGFLI